MLNPTNTSTFLRIDPSENVLGDTTVAPETAGEAQVKELQTLLGRLAKSDQDHSCTAAEAKLIIDQLVGRGGNMAITTDALKQHAQTLILVLIQNVDRYSIAEVGTFTAAIDTALKQSQPKRDSEFLHRLNAAIDELPEAADSKWDPLQGRPAAGWDYGAQNADGRDRDDFEPLN